MAMQLHIKCCTLDDKIVARPREDCMAMHGCHPKYSILYGALMLFTLILVVVKSE